MDLAKKSGLEVVLHEEYAKGSKDFSATPGKGQSNEPRLIGCDQQQL